MVDVTREYMDEYEPVSDEKYQKLNHPTEDDIIIEIYGYKHTKFKYFLVHMLSILFVGIPYLLATWYKQMKLLQYRKCSLKEADTLYVKDNFAQGNILPVVNKYIDNEHLKYFTHQHNKYIWKDDLVQFVALKVPDDSLTLNDIVSNSYGLSIEEQSKVLIIHGLNKITIDIKSYCQLFIEEVFNPFYIFQIFSIILWSFDEYYIYAGCILFLSVVSIVTSLNETKKQSISLHNLVESSNCQSIQVCRPVEKVSFDATEDEKYIEETIECVNLVPDDIIVLPQNGCVMPCDAVLLSGICIVNESMLTGESVPVNKSPPHHSAETYNVELHKRHTLFAGTQVIQTRYYGGSKVLARVIRTGFYTSKGELIKSILYPKPTGFKFYKDSIKFVLFLASVATIGMLYCIYLYTERHASLETILIRALDIITIVVPPALPAAMTVGTIYSQNRLKRRKIFCISPPRINVCGKIKLVCFDKTGTLTQDGLEFYGVRASHKKNFSNLILEPSTIDQKTPLLQGMATCHSLTRIDGEITGDPLDLSMFNSTKWFLEEPGSENTRYDMLAPTIVKPVNTSTTIAELDLDLPYEIGIIRQFQFSSTQQCMSVICRTLGSINMTVYTKGAPEKIKLICKPETIPNDFSTVLANYTTAGFRVIAFASKQLPRKFKWKDAQKVKRENIENELEFLGLIIMQNTLKPETTPIIQELHQARIRTVMVTGDNIMTAISVSRDCRMVHSNEKIALLELNNDLGNSYDEQSPPRLNITILGTATQPNDGCIINLDNTNFDHIAIEGKTWSVLKTHYSHLIPSLLLRGTIFARFQPDQKTQLVMSLQKLDYIVAMCGDGANDCGALKAANIGVSLSQAEASVAAPFTSAVQDISCVKHLMLEGRCALVTSFAVFKYMAMYSLIQFFTVLILYQRYSTLGNMQFLYIDLIITTSLAVTIGRQGPASKLTYKRPMGSLVCLVNLIPLMLQVFLCGLFQYVALYYLTLQKWFTPLRKSNLDDLDGAVLCWENTIVFTVSSFQYIILALVYSKGRPHRQSVFTNGWLLFSSIILTAFTVLLLIYPVEPLAEYFEMIPPSKNHKKFFFRCQILALPIIHFIIAIMIEICMVERRWLKSFSHFITRKKCPKNKYKKIQPIDNYDNWNNLSSSTHCDIQC